MLARVDTTALTLIDQLVGLQAQAPWAPYTGLWTRLERFVPADLADLLIARTAARTVVMRGTIHLVTAGDAIGLPRLLTPDVDQYLRTNAVHARALAGVDVSQVVETARELLEAQPLGPTELGRRLAERWPEAPSASLVHAARGLLPLVQVPPRAIWGKSGGPIWTTTHAWLEREDPDRARARPEAPGPAPGPAPDPATGLGPADSRDAALDSLVLRYLAAFGPASVADAQRWSGLTRLGPVLDRLRPQLVTFRPEPGRGAASGRELFDLPDAPRPAADTVAPVRFLPEYDNLTLSHADRARVMSEDAKSRLWRPNGAVPGTVLIDGAVAAAWLIRQKGKVATITVDPFAPLTRAQRSAVGSEADALVRFVADTADSHDVVLGDLPTP